MCAVLSGDFPIGQRITVDAGRIRVLDDLHWNWTHAVTTQIAPNALSRAAHDQIDGFAIEKVGRDGRLTAADNHRGIRPERLALPGDAIDDRNFSESMCGESNDVRHISASRKPLAAPRLQSQVHELDVMSFFLGNGREDLQDEWLVDTEKHHVVQLWKQEQDPASHAPFKLQHERQS